MVQPNDPLNEDDTNVQANLSEGFNVEPGLWEYPALSQHKPHEMMHPPPINSMLERNEVITSKKLNAATGLYSPFICKPSPVLIDGSHVSVEISTSKTVNL